MKITIIYNGFKILMSKITVAKVILYSLNTNDSTKVDSVLVLTNGFGQLLIEWTETSEAPTVAQFLNDFTAALKANTFE